MSQGRLGERGMPWRGGRAGLSGRASSCLEVQERESGRFANGLAFICGGKLLELRSGPTGAKGPADAAGPLPDVPFWIVQASSNSRQGRSIPNTPENNKGMETDRAALVFQEACNTRDAPPVLHPHEAFQTVQADGHSLVFQCVDQEWGGPPVADGSQSLERPFLDPWRLLGLGRSDQHRDRRATDLHDTRDDPFGGLVASSIQACYELSELFIRQDSDWPRRRNPR